MLTQSAHKYFASSTIGDTSYSCTVVGIYRALKYSVLAFSDLHTIMWEMELQSCKMEGTKNVNKNFLSLHRLCEKLIFGTLEGYHTHVRLQKMWYTSAKYIIERCKFFPFKILTASNLNGFAKPHGVVPPSDGLPNSSGSLPPSVSPVVIKQANKTLRRGT